MCVVLDFYSSFLALLSTGVYLGGSHSHSPLVNILNATRHSSLLLGGPSLQQKDEMCKKNIIIPILPEKNMPKSGRRIYKANNWILGWKARLLWTEFPSLETERENMGKLRTKMFLSFSWVENILPSQLPLRFEDGEWIGRSPRARNTEAVDFQWYTGVHLY